MIDKIGRGKEIDSEKELKSINYWNFSREKGERTAEI